MSEVYGAGFHPSEVLLSGGQPQLPRALVSIASCFKRKERKKEAGAAVLSLPDTQARSLQPGRSKSVAFVNNEKPKTTRVLAGMGLVGQILKLIVLSALLKQSGLITRHGPSFAGRGDLLLPLDTAAEIGSRAPGLRLQWEGSSWRPRG